MPKVIENPRDRLVAEAREQVCRAGYSGMTIHSVAGACGLGIGTVYNYFPSKDALMAAVMLEDWERCMEQIRNAATEANDPQPVLRTIDQQLRLYALEHQALFHDTDAASNYAHAASRYHDKLRTQLASPLRKFCTDDFTAEFIAESLLTWTIAGRPFEEICSILEKLF